jgi:hypothetical protein
MSADIVRFPRKTRAKVKDQQPDAEQRAARYAKWAKWKNEVPHYGGGHRKREAVWEKPSTDRPLAGIDVDKHAWREPAYRTAMAKNILESLFNNRLIGIGFGTPRLYWLSEGDWKPLSDRWAMRMLSRYLNFTRNGEALQPPRWLPEALRFTSYDFLDAEDDDSSLE